MNEEEKKTIKYFYNLRALIDEKNMLYDEGIRKEYGKEKVRQITIILNLIEKLQKENEELKADRDKFKKALAKRITYCNELEKDLFENASNYVIPVQKVKDKIEGLSKIKGDFATSIAVSERIKVLIELLESEEK